MQKHWKLSTQPGMPRKADCTAYGTVISMCKLNKSYVFCSSQERFNEGPFISDNLFMYMKTHQDTTYSVFATGSGKGRISTKNCGWLIKENEPKFIK